jgi:putative transposase
MLRRQIGQVRSERGDRLWLAALSPLAPRRRRGEVFAVTPAALLAWHRGWPRLSGTMRAVGAPGGRRRRPRSAAGDPHRDAEPRAGHRRVRGELVRLGHQIAASAVWQILHDAGSVPRPAAAARPGSSS